MWIKTSSLWVALSINTTHPTLSNTCLWHSDTLKALIQVSISAVTLGGWAAFRCDKWGPSGKTRLSMFNYRVRIWGVSVNSENGATMQLPGLYQPEMQGAAGILQMGRIQGSSWTFSLQTASHPYGLLSYAPTLTSPLYKRSMKYLW